MSVLLGSSGATVILGSSGGGVVLSPDPAAATVLATLTLTNTSGSAQATNFVSPMFGHPFVEGDVPSGEYPQFQLTDGTPCPATLWGMTTWPDGSMKYCGAMIRVPSSIAGSGTLTINVLDGGSAPSASALSTGNLSTADLSVELVGVENLTGTWTSSLNTGISDNDDLKVVGDGAAGKVWRIRQQFRDTTPANHGQLECYHYVAALQDASSGLAGVRWLPRVTQPWLDVDSPTKTFRGATASYKSAGSTSGIRQTSQSSLTFTASGSTITCTAHGLETGMTFRATTSGTLPAGMSAGTTYAARVLTANTFTLHSSAAGACNNSGAVTTTDAGSGTHTLTPHLQVNHFGSFFGANTDGTWLYVQGGGSVASDATVRVSFDKTYWRSTKVVPPYDLTLSVSAPTTRDYHAMGKGPLRVYFDETGEDDTIGVQPGWVARHIIGQSATAERVVRVGALSMGTTVTHLRRASTGTIPVVNNTSYTNMGAAAPTMRWAPSSATSGFTQPTGGDSGAITSTNSSHWPSALYYAYLITGEPQYADMLGETANFCVVQRYLDDRRNPTVGATTYYGATFRDGSQARTDAWASREVGLAAAILPDTHWDGVAIRDYMNDLMDAGYASILAYIASVGGFMQSAGQYHYRQDGGTAGYGTNWQLGFLLQSTSFVAAASKSTDAASFRDHLVKWFSQIESNHGAAHIPAYNYTARTGAASSASPLITSWDQYFPQWAGSVSWDAGTDVVQFSTLGAGTRFTVTNDDRVMFWTAAVPGGLSVETVYYVVNASGTTGQLAATAGGSALDITNTSSSSEVFLITQTPTSNKSVESAVGVQSYTSVVRAALRLAEATGATGVTTVRTAMDGQATGLDYATNPKYGLSTGY